ncbi:MAG: DUF4783 domain-containing protein [Bacteroidales bacterium]|nr:DUF4783 domain-containing protein [Bacteroidales bacterium]
MKKFTIILFLSFITFLGFTLIAGFQDATDDITKAINSGNAKELAKFFNTTIDLTLPGYEDTYSKAQAEIIVKEFFTKNAPKSFTVIHKGLSKDNSPYIIGKLETNKNSFRVTYLLRKVSDKYLIHQLRFEPKE